MFKFKKKNIWIYVILLFTVYFSYLHYKATLDYDSLISEQTIFENKIAFENEKKETLTQIEEKATSKENIESAARSGLNYLKPGEILFIDGEQK